MNLHVVWLVLRLISPWDTSIVVLLDVPGQALIDPVFGPRDSHAPALGLLEFAQNALTASLGVADARS